MRRTVSRRGEMVIGLNGAVVTVTGGQPQILTVRGGDDPGTLPFGLFDPFGQPTMELTMRTLVREQAGLDLGYVEQLYTFADRGRHGRSRHEDDPGGSHVVSVSYLALTRTEPEDGGDPWRGWYDFFPWEDWREGRPAIIDRTITPLLKKWSGGRADRADRCRRCFAPEDAWDEERVLERYELLYESGMVTEAVRDGRSKSPDPGLGQAMPHDHRRILATAMSRLRGKLKYHPVVFELMPETFTLYELQRTVEAILGIVLHKQNFRRLVERQGLVERTGSTTNRMGGRPAVLFRFRRDAR